MLQGWEVLVLNSVSSLKKAKGTFYRHRYAIIVLHPVNNFSLVCSENCQVLVTNGWAFHHRLLLYWCIKCREKFAGSSWLIFKIPGVRLICIWIWHHISMAGWFASVNEVPQSVLFTFFRNLTQPYYLCRVALRCSLGTEISTLMMLIPALHLLQNIYT